MSTFRRYDHVERWGHPDVDGIACGTCHVFPKLDGTNGSVWLDLDGMRLCAGSRNRQLTAEADNHGFHAWVQGEAKDRLLGLLSRFPELVLYGEWMIPHTLKTYREDAWRRFWIFDVWSRQLERYVPYDDWADAAREAGLDVIEPLCTMANPTEEQLHAQVETNTYLIQDGAGVGEGVVLKRYDWTNLYGRQPWAKLVRGEFKEQNRRAFGTPHKDGPFQVEVAIAEEFCTPSLVGKTRAKVVANLAQEGGIDLSEPNAQRHVEERFRGRVIPQLLERVYHDIVTESTWEAVKKHRDPSVDFKKLRSHVIARTKQYAGDLFA